MEQVRTSDRDTARSRVIVTGAASGIGAAVARRLAEDGARLLLVDVNDGVGVIAQELGAAYLVADISSIAAADLIVESAVRALGGIDGLANVAGTSGGGTVAEMSDENWRRVLGVNLEGPFRLMRSSIPHMVASGSGAIVNVSSIAGTHALANEAAYVTSKTALLGLTRSVAVDFGRQGVRCNAVAPGTVVTPMSTGLRTKPDVETGLLDLNFAGRFGEAEEVAELVLFLLSDRSAFINGETVAIDGGRAAASVAVPRPPSS